MSPWLRRLVKVEKMECLLAGLQQFECYTQEAPSGTSKRWSACSQVCNIDTDPFPVSTFLSRKDGVPARRFATGMNVKLNCVVLVEKMECLLAGLQQLELVPSTFTLQWHFFVSMGGQACLGSSAKKSQSRRA